MYSNNIAGLLSATEPNESVGFQGIYVIDKAIQQGRALDIGFDISNHSRCLFAKKFLKKYHLYHH